MTQTKRVIGYHILITILALASSILALLLLCHVPVGPIGHAINTGLWLFFVADYFIRWAITKNRKWFLIENAFDLLGIIPMHPAFALFRLGRLVQYIRAHHLFWHLGLSGKWTKNFHRFVYDTGFIYLFTISVGIICISAWLFSIVEHQTLSQSMWWAVTTATTVGYGDDSPKTAWGKMIATALMLGGVGFIGLLTSTITEFFTDRTGAADEQQQQHDALMKQLAQLTSEVDRLSKQVEKLKK